MWFGWEQKNAHKTQESPPWSVSAASSGAELIDRPYLTQPGHGRVVGGGVGRIDLLESIN